AEQVRQLLRLDQLANLFLQLALIDVVRDRCDDDLLPATAQVLRLPLTLNPDGAAPFLVNPAERRPVGDDLAAERKVRSLDSVEQLRRRRFWIADQVNGGPDHLAEIVRWDVRRHADRDTGAAVDEQVRKLRGQDGWLLELI